MPIYMNYEGINGSVTSGKYKGWIEVQSAQIGVHRNASSATANGEREAHVPSISEIIVTKQQDYSSLDLFKQSLLGEGKHVIIDFVKNPGQALYLRIELENTMISSYSASGHGGKSGGDDVIGGRSSTGGGESAHRIVFTQLHQDQL